MVENLLTSYSSSDFHIVRFYLGISCPLPSIYPPSRCIILHHHHSNFPMKKDKKSISIHRPPQPSRSPRNLSSVHPSEIANFRRRLSDKMSGENGGGEFSITRWGGPISERDPSSAKDQAPSSPPPLCCFLFLLWCSRYTLEIAPRRKS